MKRSAKYGKLIASVILLVAALSLTFSKSEQDEKTQPVVHSGTVGNASVTSVVDAGVDIPATDSQDVPVFNGVSREKHAVWAREPVGVDEPFERGLPEVLKGTSAFSASPVTAGMGDERKDDELSVADQGVFSGFDRWVDRWTAGTADAAEGQELAKQRLPVMQRLMKVSPDLAWRRSIPDEVRQRLPVSVITLLEKRVKVTGDYLVMVSSFVEIPKEKARTFRSGNQEWTAYSDHDLFQGRTHRDIHVVALAYAEMLSIPLSQNASSPIPLPAAPGSTGTKTALVMIVKRPSDSYPITLATAISRTDDAAAEYAQFSYGQFSITFDVIETAIPDSVNSFDYEARQVALGLGYNPDDYDFELYVSREVSGAYGYLFDNRTFYSSFPGRYIVHELGHNFGLYHSNWWQPDNGQPPYVKADGGQMKMYEDKWSVMGSVDNADFNIYHKQTLGWLDPSDYLDVGPTSAVFRIYSYEYPDHDLVLDTSGVDGAYYGLRMQKDALPYNGAYDYNGGERVYWISLPYQPLLSGNKDNEWYQKGVLLHFEPWLNYVNGDPGTAWNNAPYGPTLIDAYPQTTSLTGTREADDAPVRIGDTYIDAGISNVYGNIYITPLRKVDPDGIPRNGDEYVDIKIVTGDQTGNQPPTLSLVPAAWWTRVNDPVTLTADASDPDGDTDLAYLWDFGEGYNATIAAKYPVDGSNVQSYAWDSTGTYTTVVVVSDGRGGAVTQSVDITVIGIGDPSLPDIAVLGDDAVISPSDMTPNFVDKTQFGVVSTSMTNVFTITNRSHLMTVDLTNSPRVVVSDPAGHFTLSQDATSNSLLPLDATTFAVVYEPLSAGIHTALVSIASTDSEYPLYSFMVGGVTPDTPTVTNQGGLSDDSTAATLTGMLTAGGEAHAWICWGDNDGGTSSTGDWDSVVSVGTVLELVEFSSYVSGLATNATYWFRCYASNSVNHCWSDVATSFSGRAAGGSGAAVETTLSIVEVFCHNEKPNITGYPNDMISGTGMNGNLDNYSGSWPTNAPSLWTATDSGYRSEWQSQGLLDEPTYGKIGWAIFDLGAVNALENFYIWNERENSGRYTASFNVYVSETPTVVPTHGPSADTSSIDYDFTSGGWTKINGSALTGSWKGSQIVALGGATARYVAVEILTNGGDASKVGLAEVGVVASVAEGSPVGNLTPTEITASNATLNATLNAGSSDYDVHVYWGTGNGGTNAASWATNTYVGSWTNVSTNLSYSISGLTADQTYYYTFMASNTGGVEWASPSWTFSTLPVVSGGNVTTNHAVPHSWLTAVHPAWTNDFEAAVTNDWDGDGFTTAQEYWAGTDPTNSSSFLQIDSIEFSDGHAVVRWQHAHVDAGLPPIYIQGCSNLVTGIWSDAELHYPENGDNVWSNTVTPYPYFRLVVPSAQ